MFTKSCKKSELIFECKYCDYTTSRKSSFDKHLLTSKHDKTLSVNNLLTESCKKLQKVAMIGSFACEQCNKEYKSRVGLWKHKKSCSNLENNTTKEDVDLSEKELIMMLIKQNSELLEVVKHGTCNNSNHFTTNINSNNKSFNLQFFLNETCKDAMNIMEFVDSIQLQLSDLEKVGELGYVNGISNIIIKHLKELDITKRPVHCTDKKREVMYIKDDNKWEKDDSEKKKIRKMIKKIANKNIRLLQIFKEVHPDCNDSESSCSDQYNKIIVESMGGSGDNDVEKEDKIIRKIAKEVTIDKEG
jgi:hypothetical protein